MSLEFVVPLITEGYGLRDEDLNEIILIERLNDVSKKFSGAIRRIQDKFDSKARIRLIEFSELSGSTPDSKLWYSRLIHGHRHIFHSHVHSNKNCCVLFYYAGCTKDRTLLNKRVLPHEFAHYYQWASQGFPCLLPRGIPKEFVPQFAKYGEIGPRTGQVYIDNMFLDDKPFTVIKDFNERISDFVCEGILREKEFNHQYKEGFLEEYREDRNRDPAKGFSILGKAVVTYMRRLALRDVAEWHALLHLEGLDDESLQGMLVYDKKWITRKNKKYDKAKKAFNEIYKISLNSDFSSFKHVRNAVSYIKTTTDLLGIEIRTKEKW